MKTLLRTPLILALLLALLGIQPGGTVPAAAQQQQPPASVAIVCTTWEVVNVTYTDNGDNSVTIEIHRQRTCWNVLWDAFGTPHYSAPWIENDVTTTISYPSFPEEDDPV